MIKLLLLIFAVFLFSCDLTDDEKKSLYYPFYNNIVTSSSQLEGQWQHLYSAYDIFDMNYNILERDTIYSGEQGHGELFVTFTDSNQFLSNRFMQDSGEVYYTKATLSYEIVEDGGLYRRIGGQTMFNYAYYLDDLLLFQVSDSVIDAGIIVVSTFVRKKYSDTIPPNHWPDSCVVLSYLE